MPVCHPPRIAATPFLKLPIPDALQSRIQTEYRKLSFKPVATSPARDEGYGATSRGGISGQGLPGPDVQYAPISSGLFDYGYEILTPLIQDWAGCELLRSFGYGIRSYGRHSVLHLHRDRVDTHVISVIIHVDERGEFPWPLDFIDHDGRHHRVGFEPGEMLFYESLCPHARLEPFRGAFYRNMYLHWRPVGWDPACCNGMKSKYASIAECLAEWERDA